MARHPRHSHTLQYVVLITVIGLNKLNSLHYCPSAHSDPMTIYLSYLILSSLNTSSHSAYSRISCQGISEPAAAVPPFSGRLTSQQRIACSLFCAAQSMQGLIQLGISSLHFFPNRAIQATLASTSLFHKVFLHFSDASQGIHSPTRWLL